MQGQAQPATVAAAQSGPVAQDQDISASASGSRLHDDVPTPRNPDAPGPSGTLQIHFYKAMRQRVSRLEMSISSETGDFSFTATASVRQKIIEHRFINLAFSDDFCVKLSNSDTPVLTHCPYVQCAYNLITRNERIP